MANVFLSYVDSRLKEGRKSQKLSWLGLYIYNTIDSSFALKSFAGTARALSQAPETAALLTQVAATNAIQILTAASAPVSQHAALPISYDGKLKGVLLAEATDPVNFQSPACIESLKDFAAQIASLWVQPVSEYAILLDQKIALLKESDPRFDWCGVYKLVKGNLYLVSFRGHLSPHEVIPQNKGICGAAVRENQTLNIPDVTRDTRYLACDSKTRSEIVVPIRNDAGEPIGEIDIDSYKPNAFTDAEKERLEKIAKELTPLMVNLI